MSCQIAIVYGDQVAAIEVLQDKLTFQGLLQQVAEKIDFDAIPLEAVYFVYEDDDGDKISVLTDADLSEAVAIQQDAGVDELMLVVKVKASESLEEEKHAGEVKLNEVDNGEKLNTFDEAFVLEVVKLLDDDHVRSVIPEIGALISAAVLRRESSAMIFEQLGSKYPFLKDLVLFKINWSFVNDWKTGFDAWIVSLTEDQLAKVAFQIPILMAKLVGKRKGLHRALFLKHKPLSKFMNAGKQFDFGEVNIALLLENLGKTTDGAKAVEHLGTKCAQCSKCPIDGVRFKCMVCVNFDLCEDCEKKGGHPTDHALMKFSTPSASYVGLLSMPDKKLFKMQMKAMKMEHKVAKKELKLAKKEEKLAHKLVKMEHKMAKKAERHAHKEARASEKLAKKLSNSSPPAYNGPANDVASYN